MDGGEAVATGAVVGSGSGADVLGPAVDEVPIALAVGPTT